VSQPPPPYDLNPLLERFSATYRRLETLNGEPKKRKERKGFHDIADKLCQFFRTRRWREIQPRWSPLTTRSLLGAKL
jgi:hypothetical protein